VTSKHDDAVVQVEEEKDHSMNLSGHIPLVQNTSTVSDYEDMEDIVNELDIENKPR